MEHNINQSETELHVIKKIINDSRKIIGDNGWHYILWGAVVTLALVINYLMIISRTGINYQGLVWLILMTATWITEVIIEKRLAKKRNEKTFGARLLSSLWFASGISLFIFGFVGLLTKAYNPVYICPMVSTVLGVAYLMSGAIQQIKWLQLLTIGWWGGAVLMFLFPSIHTLLIFAGMMVFFQIIPGSIIYRKWKASNIEALV